MFPPPCRRIRFTLFRFPVFFPLSVPPFPGIVSAQLILFSPPCARNRAASLPFSLKEAITISISNPPAPATAQNSRTRFRQKIKEYIRRKRQFQKNRRPCFNFSNLHLQIRYRTGGQICSKRAGVILDTLRSISYSAQRNINDDQIHTIGQEIYL